MSATFEKGDLAFICDAKITNGRTEAVVIKDVGGALITVESLDLVVYTFPLSDFESWIVDPPAENMIQEMCDHANGQKVRRWVDEH